MELIKNIETFGQVKYIEKFWTGKKILFIDSVEANMIAPKTFAYLNDDKKYYIELKGNLFFGLKMIANDSTYVLENAFKWYEYLIALISLVFVLIWGNFLIRFIFIWGQSDVMRKISPFVCSTIGGVSVLIPFLPLLAMRTQKKQVLRIVVGLLTCLASIAFCDLIRYLIVLAIL